MTRQYGDDPSPDDFDERPARKKVKITKPAYADFKEKRDGKQQLTCECGSQHWHLWDDEVASCAICGLPEPIIRFTIRSAEAAEEFLEDIMNA